MKRPIDAVYSDNVDTLYDHSDSTIRLERNFDSDLRSKNADNIIELESILMQSPTNVGICSETGSVQMLSSKDSDLVSETGSVQMLNFFNTFFQRRNLLL